MGRRCQTGSPVSAGTGEREDEAGEGSKLVTAFFVVVVPADSRSGTGHEAGGGRAAVAQARPYTQG